MIGGRIHPERASNYQLDFNTDAAAICRAQQANFEFTPATASNSTFFHGRRTLFSASLPI
jgi:hypothetical protein